MCMYVQVNSWSNFGGKVELFVAVVNLNLTYGCLFMELLSIWGALG